MRVFMVVVLSTVLGACTTLDPYSGESKTSKATKGASIGAIAGAVIGAATSSKSDREKGAIRGALAGAATGGGIGYYMDRQEKALRDRLAGSGVQVAREGDNIRLVMPGSITFDTGQSSIRSNFYNALDSVALVLAEFKDTTIKVAGHTDSTGGADLNQRLSEQRASSVASYLINQGVVSGRVNAVGFGYRYPVADNNTASGRQANRRVELELQPTQ